MQLCCYIDRFVDDLQDFADEMKVTVGTIYSWLSGKKIPSRTKLRLLFKVTKERVAPNDIHNLHPSDTKQIPCDCKKSSIVNTNTAVKGSSSCGK